MALSNYTELQAAIITHAMRDGDTGFAAAVPDLIALALPPQPGIALPRHGRSGNRHDYERLGASAGRLP